MKVIYPSGSFPETHFLDTTRVKIEFGYEPDVNFKVDLDLFKVPLFSLEYPDDVDDGDVDKYYVLITHLAQIWNYPSSYQLMNKFLKKSNLSKQDFLRTNKQLNHELAENGLIGDDKFHYFYIEVSKIYQNITNKQILVGDDDYDEMDEQLFAKQSLQLEDKITLNQVFPSYGFINSAVDLKHSTFNCLTNLSKYNYYKVSPSSPKFMRSKLLPHELEIFYNINDYAKLDLNNNEILMKTINKRKPLGKPRKNHTNIDPNNLDLHESVIPGQGFIQEFNINHLCKIPNYYITNQQQHQQYQQAPSSLPGSSNISKPKDSKISRNIQQLVFNNNEFDNTFNVGRYFYSKTYRGPGSGNYKDASLVNRINKIPMDSNNSIRQKHIKESYKNRFNLHLKGLIPEKFNKSYVDSVLTKQRGHVEDYDNLEMLHNTLEFNLLVNTYRDISYDTWINYYKFKFMDFEKMVNEKGEEVNHYLLSRFNLPTDYNEIIRNLPLEFREKVKTPLYYNLKLPDNNNPQLLTNVDIIKLPNSNEIAWDNLKKYQE